MFLKSQIEEVDTSNLPPPDIQSCGRKVVSDAQRARMKLLYEQGLSTWKIGSLFGYKNVCVINNLKKAGMVLRNRSDTNKTISVNRDYFREIDTHTKAYLLRLFYADGNVSKDSFTLALQEPDKYLVEAIAKEIEFTGELGFRPPRGLGKQNMWVLRIHDQTFCDRLRKLGVVPRKTSKVSFPYFISKDFYWSFLHGLFDGDGCVSFDGDKTFGANIAGSPYIIPQIAQLVQQELGIHMNVRNPKGSQGWICTCSRIMALRFLASVFKDPKNFFMTRKYDKFIAYLSKYKNGHRMKKFNPILAPIATQYLK